MNDIIHTNSDEEFIYTICETIKEEANRNLEEKGSFTLVLSGGRTPKVIFQELAKNYQKSISWEKVHFFWVDERCVPPTHQDSNYRLAYDYLISKLGRVGSVHRIQGELVPEQAASIYEQEIINFFEGEDVKFDFMLLGMGEDGHVASLFPESRGGSVSETLTVSTKKKHGCHYRVSMSLDVINASKFNLLIIWGQRKKLLFDRYRNTHRYPISKIILHQVVAY